MARYTLSYDSSSVTFRVTGLTRGQYVELYLRLESGSTAIVQESYTATSTSLSKTFYVVSPGKDYAANVKVGASGSTATWIGKQSFTTPKEESRPSVDRWSWNSSNGSASASQTMSAHSAVTSRGKTNNFSYLVWNDMVDKVNELVRAYGKGWDGRYASLSSTRMSSYDKEITAIRFNSLRLNLSLSGSHSFSTWIPTVSRGDTVYGSYFANIATEINRLVDEL